MWTVEYLKNLLCACFEETIYMEYLVWRTYMEYFVWRNYMEYLVWGN